ncbi:MAG: VWA domain-containing protein [Chloroflexota bacterium]
MTTNSINALFSNSETLHSMEESERTRRWRLILGRDDEASDQPSDGQSEDVVAEMISVGDADSDEEGDGTAQGEASGTDQDIERLLDAIYGQDDQGGDGPAAPELARLLGDLRRYFPASVAQVMQADLFKRINLRKALLEADFLAEVEPDFELVSKLILMNRVLPPETREVAREVVCKVVEDLQEKLDYPLRQALTGSLNRALRAYRPRKLRDIHWLQTIRANLKHYQPEQRAVIPETLVGYGRQWSSLRDVILCIDQSASMGASVIYASIFGSVMATMPALDTRLVLFSTNVVDMTDQLDDPIDLLFGVQLKGGTNIGNALDYCQQVVRRPQDTILVLITDLYEGGKKDRLLQRAASLVESGVQVIVLLALNDQGTPRFNRQIAKDLVDLGVPSFACTPDLFPDLMAAAINRQDIQQWAATHQIVTAPRN